MNSTSILDSIKSSMGISGSVDAYQMLINVYNNSQPVVIFVTALAYCISIWLVFSGILHLKKAGLREDGNETPTKAFLIFFIAVLMFYLPSFISSVSFSILGSSGESNVFSYAKESSVSDKINAAREAVFWFIYVAGIIAVVRGLLIFKDTVEGDRDSSVAKGVWHIIGGAFAMHMQAVIQVFKSTAGM